MLERELIVVRGGGDMATAVVQRLWRAGFRVLVLECEKPSAIRRQVAVSEAVYEGCATVEDLTAMLISAPEEALTVWERGCVPVMVPDQDQPDETVKSMLYAKADSLLDVIELIK